MSEDPNRKRAQELGLYGLLDHWEEVGREAWVAPLLEWEEQLRSRRSLERRIAAAKIGRFKAMADFDYAWPTQLDRDQLEELFGLQWVGAGHNAVLHGGNGLGKTMVAQNLAYQAVLAGHTVLFCTAGQMLNDLAAQDGPCALERRIARYCRPALLGIDELGYLSYDSRYADLLFEIVSRRYRSRSILLTTNKAFSEWGEVFPHASCVVSLIDRLVHHAEILSIEGESYRLKEAREQTARKARERAARKRKKSQSS